jgi:hypothetical protein
MYFNNGRPHFFTHEELDCNDTLTSLTGGVDVFHTGNFTENILKVARTDLGCSASAGD